MLFLFLLSVGLYMFLGHRLRTIAADPTTLKPPTSVTNSAEITEEDTVDTSKPPSGAPPAVKRDTSITKISAEDLKVIQGIFALDTFFMTEAIPFQDGAIFKGNLRGEVDSSYARLSKGLQERVGDRYRLFLVLGQEDKPVVVVLPSTNDPQPTTLTQKGIALVLALVTLATCLETAGSMLDFDLTRSLHRFSETLPIGLGIIFLLIVHELAHRVLAARYQVRLSPPFFIPAWQIGSFGALTRFESLLPNRRVFFDIAFAGPATAGLLSLILLIVGLGLSHGDTVLQLPAVLFQGSILVGVLARVMLGDALQHSLVGIHPCVLVGWLGLILTAINLLPAGQLDGGRIIQAIYGRKIAGWATVITLVLLGLAALVNTLALYWAIVILFLQRDLERPALNELSEPDDIRAALGLLALFLMVLTLLPLTPNLAGRLGIGG